jgi:hypothetical protein
MGLHVFPAPFNRSSATRPLDGAAVAVVLAAGIVTLAGCSATRVGEPLTSTLGEDAPQTQMDFWHRLTEEPVTCNDDAFHGLLLFLDGRDTAGDYDERVQALKQRRLLAAGFDEPADFGIRRGTFAEAIVKVLKIRGGLTMHVAGPTPRYAVRELQYLRIYPRSSAHQTFSGDEFVSVIGRVEDYQRSKGISLSQDVTP